MNFHERVKGLPWIAYAVTGEGSPVMAVNNQLLVDTKAAPGVKTYLKEKHQVTSQELTTLLRGLQPVNGAYKDTIVDVIIFELEPDPGSSFDPHLPYSGSSAAKGGIFWLTDQLREKGPAAGGLEKTVSPNHVLIPAGVEDSCPSGPPIVYAGDIPTLGPTTSPRVPVTVIDSGWQAWAKQIEDPLYGSVTVHHAERLPTLKEAQTGGHEWQKGDPDKLGETVPDPVTNTPKLMALAGHSNFIAGVIVQGCPGAQIAVVSHNGSFVEAPDRPTLLENPQDDPNCWDFPTEAAVARSLCWSLSKTGALPEPAVINIGFSFQPWTSAITAPGISSTATGTVSCIWDRVFQYIGPAPMVVCPSGNQESTLRRYPAAFAAPPSNSASIVGVASIAPPRETSPQGGGVPPQLEPSSFSNTGDPASADDWVRASAHGEDVVSTFIEVNVPLEERTDDIPQDFTNGWAMWNGTSFATPKIVAAIAKEYQAMLSAYEADPANNPAPTPQDAWENVAPTGVQPTDPNGNPVLGIGFPNL